MGALDGLKVAEAGLLVQGPQAAATLGEWGADVVKVELPGYGDQSRWLPVQPGDSRSAYFIGCNRGKRSLTVDLRTPDGRAVFLRLAEWADVIISNFAPGTMDGWGCGYDDVAARNPRVVYAAGSTFGTEGDACDTGRCRSQRSGRGWSHQHHRARRHRGDTGGRDDRRPHRGAEPRRRNPRRAVPRERTGRGQCITTSLLGAQIWAQASEYFGCFLRGQPAGRANRGHALIPGLYGIFRTADGWIAVVGVVGKQRQRFFEVVGRPELGERFPERFYWDEEKAALFPLLDEAFSTADTATWCERLGAAGLRHAPVRDHAEVIADPDVWANGYLVNVDGTDVVAAPVRFSATPAQPSAVAPELGQHTEEVLLELGYSWDDIARLQDAGAI